MGNKHAEERKPSKPKTPTFLLELPLMTDAGQSARLGAHLEAGRQFYNAVLSAGQQRLRRMRADPAWQAACAIPRTQPQERRAALWAPGEGSHVFTDAFPSTPAEHRGPSTRAWWDAWSPAHAARGPTGRGSATWYN